MLDYKTLGDYDFATGSIGRILYVGILVPNSLYGSAAIFYSAGLIQVNVPFEESQTVQSLRTELSLLTGIPVGEIFIMDYDRNPAQDNDNGIWQDQKQLVEYGMSNGELVELVVVRKGEGWFDSEETPRLQSFLSLKEEISMRTGIPVDQLEALEKQ